LFQGLVKVAIGGVGVKSVDRSGVIIATSSVAVVLVAMLVYRLR
jgi:hypothetical protein